MPSPSHSRGCPAMCSGQVWFTSGLWGRNLKSLLKGIRSSFHLPMPPRYLTGPSVTSNIHESQQKAMSGCVLQSRKQSRAALEASSPPSSAKSGQEVQNSVGRDRWTDTHINHLSRKACMVLLTREICSLCPSSSWGLQQSGEAQHPLSLLTSNLMKQK